MSDDFTHFKFKHPFTCVVSGPTSTGKTILVRKILENWKSLIQINCSELNVLWYYGQTQALYNQQIDNVKMRYISGTPKIEEIKNIKPNIIVFDDLMSELNNSDEVVNIFTRASHHLNMSVIFIVQNIFNKGRHMRTINLNTQYIILTKNRRDLAQIGIFGGQIYPTKSKLFRTIYLDATSEPYGYLLYDANVTTPENLRIRTNIIPVNGKLNPIYYEI